VGIGGGDSSDQRVLAGGQVKAGHVQASVLHCQANTMATSALAALAAADSG